MPDLSVWWGRFVIVTIFVCSMVGLYFNHNSPYMIFTIIVITALFLTTFTCSVGTPLLLMRAAAAHRALNRHSQENTVWTVETGPPRYDSVVTRRAQVPPTPPPPYHYVMDMPPPYKVNPDQEDKPESTNETSPTSPREVAQNPQNIV